MEVIHIDVNGRDLSLICDQASAPAVLIEIKVSMGRFPMLCAFSQRRCCHADFRHADPLEP
jgi:hypothetical protein